MSPLLLQSKAADVRRDRRLVRSLPSRSSSREGGKVADLNFSRPRAAADEFLDADTDAEDLFGQSFKGQPVTAHAPSALHTHILLSVYMRHSFRRVPVYPGRLRIDNFLFSPIIFYIAVLRTSNRVLFFISAIPSDVRQYKPCIK
jgi:hypothetical protein